LDQQIQCDLLLRRNQSIFTPASQKDRSTMPNNAHFAAKKSPDYAICDPLFATVQQKCKSVIKTAIHRESRKTDTKYVLLEFWQM